MRGAICGPVRNCAPYLDAVIDNMEAAGEMFESYHIFLFYDESRDNSMDILLCRQEMNSRITIFVNDAPLTPFRTHNIANARNVLLNAARDQADVMLMMDCDDVCALPINVHTLSRALQRTDWDVLSFNSSPYLDIWALSLFPYCFSYNHFKNNVAQYSVIQAYVESKLNGLPSGKLLPCLSSFNGAALYRLGALDACTYDGRINVQLVTADQLQAHATAAKSDLIFKDYGNVRGQFEDCEHRAFHVQAGRNGALLRISPEILFGSIV